MLERRRATDGTLFYASPLLQAVGVRHAFSTRVGGTSPAPFDSLNLGNPSGCASQDDDARIQSNYIRLQHAIGCAGLDRRWVHQVHGGICLSADDTKFENGQRADALFGRNPAQVLAIRTADCVAILLSDDAGGAVAAVHAGWRGVIAAVLAATVARFPDPPATLRAAIGPCISKAAFEVGPEVLAAFTESFGGAAPVTVQSAGKGLVDLREACRLQLLGCGLSDDRIDTTDRCTVTHADEFFSHRRDAGVTGRMAALVAPRASS